MRKGLNLIAGAVVMAVGGGSAFAADVHPAFDSFTVTGGVIDMNSIGDCGTKFTCSVVAGGDGGGFLQYMATSLDASGDPGKTYIGTIVTDATADNSGANKQLGFVDQSYVRMEMCGGTNCTGTNGGISGKQSIYEEGTDGTTFASNVAIATGQNFSGTGPSIIIGQSLLNKAAVGLNPGDDFMSDFFYEAKNNVDTGVREGFVMQIDQIAGLKSPTDDTTLNDVQSFSYREAQGSRQQSASSSPLTIGGVTGSVAFANDDDIKAVWLGQDVGAAGSFSYLSFENKDAAANATGLISNFSLTDASGPGADWNAAFNLSFAGNHPINGTALGASSAPRLDDPSGRSTAP